MKDTVYLSDINPGKRVKVKSLLVEGSIRRRLMDIGLVEDTVVECIGRSPLGDPSAYLIRGAVIALRQEDSGRIIVNS